MQKIVVTVENYPELASKTCKDLGTLELNNEHMQMGIITEISELIDVLKKQLAYGKDIDWVNVKEEIGDAKWYIANACIFNNHNFAELIELADKQNNALKSLFDKESLFKMLKNILFDVNNEGTYNDINLTFTKENTINLLCVLQVIITKFTTFTLEEVLQTNIDKLSARFPDGFTQYHALNRNLDTEREILEK